MLYCFSNSSKRKTVQLSIMYINNYFYIELFTLCNVYVKKKLKNWPIDGDVLFIRCYANDLTCASYITHVIKMLGTCSSCYSAYKKVVMTLPKKDRPLLVKHFYKNTNCSAVALNKYSALNSLRNGSGPMKEFSWHYIINKL